MTDTAIRVHPVAALLPMLTEEELDDLAADIKANGLLHPIVLDADGVLIDGRNRLEACRRAGVAPTYATLDGHDPVAFVLSSNVTRRHLNAGQRAMAVALAARFAANRSTRVLAGETGVSQSRIAKAAVVLAHAPFLADPVLAGRVGLDAAYGAARLFGRCRERQDAVETLLGRWGDQPTLFRDEAEAITRALAENAGDLWELVLLGERMGVPAALGMTTREWTERYLLHHGEEN